MDCRVANAVYQKIYRAKLKAGAPLVRNGYQTSLLLRSLSREGYRPAEIGRELGLCRQTVYNHFDSSPARLTTIQRVRVFWKRLRETTGELDPEREQVAAVMLKSLGWDHVKEAAAWQDVPNKDDEWERVWYRES